MYKERTYRNQVKGENLTYFNVKEQETDLQIGAHRLLESEAKTAIEHYRRQIECYIRSHPQFKTSLTPSPVNEEAPSIIKTMAEAAKMTNVGPMAAVAGAISEAVGKELLSFSPEIIVENGGDLFIKSNTVRRISIFAGTSPFNQKIALKIKPEDTPLGICTSAGTVGPSLSFGKADAVVVVSKNTALADAAATATGNMIKTAADIEQGITFAQSIVGIKGVIIIIGDKMGAWGDICFVNS